MADWYVSSAVYAAVPVWQPSTVYTVGQLVKPTAPAAAKEYVFRCTTAGTSGGTEPTWSAATTNNATRTDGTVTWTNVSGQSAYGWSAAAGTLMCLITRPLVGDRVFLSSDHSESLPGGLGSYGFNANTAAFGLIQLLSVNRAGSVPPAAVDLLPGAALAMTSGTFILESYTNTFWQGVTFTVATTILQFNSLGNKSLYLKNCAIVITSNSNTTRIGAANVAKVTLDNTTIQFGHASQCITPNSVGLDITWINTPLALRGVTPPTTLITTSANFPVVSLTARGVDFSALVGNLISSFGGANFKALLDSCRIAFGLTRLALSGSAPTCDEVELVNCFDGTNVLNERYTQAGAITTDRSTTLSGGAQDDIGAYSLMLASSSRADKAVLTLDSFWLDVENIATGSSKTATVEIISSGTLNDDDISLLLEYMGTSGSAVASFVSSLPAALAAGTAVPTSSVTWNNPPATPVKQKLQVTFTPQRAGRVRGLVRLGKPSTAVWINPQIAIS